MTTEKISQLANSEEFKKVLPYLLAGGVGAGAGAIATGSRNIEKDETRLQHLGRVLRNALIAGGLAAGGTALVNQGIKRTAGAVDKENFSTGSPGNEGPLSTGLKGALFSPVSAGLAGATGLALTHNFSNIGAGTGDMANNAKMLAKRLGMSEADFAPKTPKDIDAAIRSKAQAAFKGVPYAAAATDQQTLDELMRLRRGAGMVGGDTPLKRIVSLVSRRGPMSTFGQTTGRRLGRASLGGAAAAVPALVGAALTSDTRPE